MDEPRNRSGSRTKFATPRVLVVDDIEENRELYATALTDAGFEVELAADGLDAIDSALLRRPDVIVMDLSMPTLDGWETTRRIRAHVELKGIYVIAFSAHDEASSVRMALDAGCDEFVKKPCAVATLVARVTSAIRRRPQTIRADSGS